MDYSTEKHKDQKRKNSKGHPYICHPVRVARRLLVDGGVDDVSTLVAALLHDTVEDTDATLEEIEQLFGSEIAHLVDEVSDDKSLPKKVRKQKQIQNAPFISCEAKVIKLADKLDNLTELVEIAPIGWDQERVKNYFDWAEAVVKGLRGVNSVLEEQLDDVFLRKDVAAKAAGDASVS
ncbi:Guanosine-3',5'-bis(diphosphate) 3'-pyrophosphohydrolase MESH1 [Gracilaria domingensis]|nr:Guanosine-3',5'-bis(diphosphate) 3'-pyrophosphohydrolase MESH1 [Gracilaria domingensis]